MYFFMHTIKHPQLPREHCIELGGTKVIEFSYTKMQRGVLLLKREITVSKAHACSSNNRSTKQRTFPEKPEDQTIHRP